MARLGSRKRYGGQSFSVCIPMTSGVLKNSEIEGTFVRVHPSQYIFRKLVSSICVALNSNTAGIRIGNCLSSIPAMFIDETTIRESVLHNNAAAPAKFTYKTLR